MRNEKKLNNNLIKRWWFWTIIATIIIAVILITIILISKPKFEVSNFELEKETTNYTTIDNETRYTGKGTIKTKDKKNNYLVVVKQELKSGGTNTSEKIEYFNVLVSEGKGEFLTYEYGSVNEIKKPEYDFEVIAYLKFK